LLAPYIDLAFLSIDSWEIQEIKEFTKKVINFFRNNPILVVTRGKKGSIAFINDKIITQDPIEAERIDSLGCGDAYIGAFLSEYIKNNGDVKKCLLRGTQIATENLKRFGAW
jgi:fructoselysine 6-kinase